MKIIVGLGNPGQKYRGTRHNIGFEVIAALHKRFDHPRPTARFNSELVMIRIGSEQVILQSPLTFMNVSGRAVQPAMSFYKLLPADLLVVCDDFNLPLGRLRIKPGGSAGGQNGLQDIIQRLGTQDFARLRIGIGRPPEEWDPADWVLGRFRDEESAEIELAIQRAVEAAITWVERGVQPSMNKFNADPTPAKTEPETTRKSRADRAAGPPFDDPAATDNDE
jgi:PTH1 family peptidyl-tRNA hydrolase